jgi:hypothetical protein
MAESCGNVEDVEMLRIAVKSVILDEGYDLATEKSQKARLIAERLLRFIETNYNATTDFAAKLVQQLRVCCSNDRPMSFHKFKEQMWEKFYELCSDEEFRTMWITFIHKSVGIAATAIFYQYVTREILHQLIKIQFPAGLCSVTPGAHHETTDKLDFEQSNALRYCGGYLIYSLKKRIRKSAHPLKNELLLCLDDIVESDDQDSTEIDDSEKWLQTIDRGGLIYIDDCMFDFLVATEIEIRKSFADLQSTDDNLKDIAIHNIIKNEDVLCYWDFLSINWDTDEAKALLQLIVTHYVTIRGFSFAKSFMEKYKQSMKKTTQKSKGLRKKLDN